ncbi:hypothetical protein DOTSEDRAFT_73258 [Dothistroma septosporum NZE10]|uniref:Uncharacterized protein n=1 Tax=Dothistroma septosporum (strain NZE10 / CBS 128990) TaxID=675120 RepID=N1PJ03_DOTSN|nr:hypothetical protein DOTSEDRAFT_73258 [Dothistroma septosporum NZE10]
MSVHPTRAHAFRRVNTSTSHEPASHRTIASATVATDVFKRPSKTQQITGTSQTRHRQRRTHH